MGTLVLAATEGKPKVQLFDLESGEVTPVATAFDREDAAFDHALARSGWVAVQVGRDVTAFADGSLLSPVALPQAWQVMPGASADEVLLSLYEGRSLEANEPLQLVVIGADAETRRRATLPLWFPVGEVDGLIVAEEALWSWDGSSRDHPVEGRAIAVLGGQAIVMQHHTKVRLVELDGSVTAECEVPAEARFGIGVEYDATGERVAATAFEQRGVLVVHRRSVQWIPLPFEPRGPVWLDAHQLLFFDYFANVATIVDVATQSTSILELPRKCPIPVLAVDDRFDPEALRAVLRPTTWSPPTPTERDRTYEDQRAALDEAAPAHLRSLVATAQPSVRLRSYLPAKRTPMGTSRVGGRPDLPAGMKWPTYNGIPMAFLAQIRLDEAAAVAPAGALPKEGLLVVFVGLEVDGMYPVEDDAVNAVVVNEGTLERARWPRALSEQLRFNEATLLPEPTLSLLDFPDGLDEQDESRWGELVRQFTPTGPHHRMLGHPVSVQGYEPAGDRVLLLQVDSDGVAGVSFGDGGSLHIFTSEASLRRGEIESCTIDLDSY